MTKTSRMVESGKSLKTLIVMTEDGTWTKEGIHEKTQDNRQKAKSKEKT
jgi:hypothetical protein